LAEPFVRGKVEEQGADGEGRPVGRSTRKAKYNRNPNLYLPVQLPAFAAERQAELAAAVAAATNFDS
jgi:hypothetical protein